MIEINIIGTVKEILWKSERSCKLLIENSNGELAGTITRARKELADKIAPGKEYHFKGDIAAYKKGMNNGGIYIENTFYILDLEAIEKNN